MRLFGKSVFPKNGYPWCGVVKLMKDAVLRGTQKGMIWSAFGTFETPPKGDMSGNGSIGLKAFAPASDSLVAWQKGTVLFVAGALHKDEYWSKQKGSDQYSVVCEFVIEQPDYNKVYATEIAKMAGIDVNDTANMEDNSPEYVPDF